jgi:hypothetical protein
MTIVEDSFELLVFHSLMVNMIYLIAKNIYFPYYNDKLIRNNIYNKISNLY